MPGGGLPALESANYGRYCVGHQRVKQMPAFRREPYDLIGVGFGPANIGLAVAIEESGWEGSALFLERRAGPDWQPGMLLDGADIQHHPLRDFVTPRNPLSP